jgi:hypothetical protein
MVWSESLWTGILLTLMKSPHHRTVLYATSLNYFGPLIKKKKSGATIQCIEFPQKF